MICNKKFQKEKKKRDHRNKNILSVQTNIIKVATCKNVLI